MKWVGYLKLELGPGPNALLFTVLRQDVVFSPLRLMLAHVKRQKIKLIIMN